jgi:hypothetical protein
VTFPRLWAVLFGCSLTVSWTSVTCADEVRDRAAARTAADQGADAFEQGNHARALELFSRAERLFHAPPHLLFMARSLEKLGRLVEARETYLKLVSEKLPAGAPSAFKKAQAAGESELNAIEGRLSYVTLRVHGDDGESALASMDGAQLPAAMVGISIPVDPGTHVFSARSPRARSSEVKVTLQEGARQTVELVLSEAVAPSPARTPVKETASPAEPAELEPRSRRPGSSQGTWGFVTLGVGAGIAGVGTGFMIASLNSRSESDRIFACNDTSSCTVEQKAEISELDADSERNRRIATAGFIAGGAVMATGIILVLTAPSDHGEVVGSRSELRLVAGPGWLGAAGRF